MHMLSWCKMEHIKCQKSFHLCVGENIEDNDRRVLCCKLYGTYMSSLANSSFA